jgi:integrase
MRVLRHYYASVLIRRGRNVKEVSERLGHANAAMTLNVYSHLFPDAEDGTREAIDAEFGPAQEDHVPRKCPES